MKDSRNSYKISKYHNIKFPDPSFSDELKQIKKQQITVKYFHHVKTNSIWSNES